MKVIFGAGQELELGTLETAPTIEITDFSRRVTDDFGVTTVVERGFSRRMSVRLALPFDSVDSVQQKLAQLRATAAQWVADERYAWLNVEGFYKDFNLDLAVPPTSFCTLTVEGLAQSEAGVDSGGEAAPTGSSSTLRLLQPIDITDSVLTSSSVAEDDHPVWTAGTTYAAGARVISTATHRIYESVSSGNVGNDPTTQIGAWIDVAPTNRWAMFDQALGTKTTSATAITLTLNVTGANAVALLDVATGTVRVQADGYDRTLAVSAGVVPFLDLPLTTGTITVTISGASPSVGTLLVGRLLTLGVSEAAPTAGINDYSRKQVDEFGQATVVERAWAKRMAVRSLIRSDAVDLVANRIASVRATPCLWLGSDDLNTLSVYGFFKDFSIEVGEAVSKLNLSVEGLSEAPPTPDGLPFEIDWDDITGVNKPEDGATRNVYRGAWAAGVAYQVGDIVTHSGSSYICTAAHISSAGSPPPNANFSLLAAGNPTADGADPGIATGLSTTSSFESIWLNWTNPSNPDLIAVEIWENTTNNSATATRIATRAARPGSSDTAATRVGLTPNTTRWYWIKTVDNEGNVSGFSAGVSGTTAFIPALNISGTLADAQIAAVAASKVTGQLSSDQIAAIAAAKISGQLTNAQLADIAAAKVTGTLADSQIAAVAAPKITGTLTDSQLAGLSASKLTGTIVSTQITDGAISTPKLAAGAVTTANLAAGAITASKLTIVSLDSVIPDSQMQDLAWWAQGAANIQLTSTAAPWWAEKALRFLPGTHDVFSQFFGVEIGATYKISAQIQTSADFNGWFRPVVHMPNIHWFNLKTGTGLSGEAPAVNDSSAIQTANYYAELDWTFTNPTSVLNAANRQWQFRFTGSWTVGEAYVVLKIVRVSDGTLIKDGAITTVKVAASAITANELAAGSVVAGKIAAGTIVAADIAASTITGAKIAGQTITAANIAADTITASQIAASAITSTKLAAGAIVAGKIAAGTIQAGDIAAGAVTSDKIAANNILAGHIAALQIVGGHIQAGQITSDKMNVTQLSAITANVGLLRTASSGARVEMEANQIRVYDSSNVLRVRLGVW